MPDGIYLDARILGVKRLAEEMNNIIRNPQRYIDFFKWRGYYTFYDTYGFENNDTYSVCNICSTFNKRIQSKRRTMYTYINEWWNGKDNKTNSATASVTSTTTDNINEKMNPIVHDAISNLYDIMFDT